MNGITALLQLQCILHHNDSTQQLSQYNSLEGHPKTVNESLFFFFQRESDAIYDQETEWERVSW